MLFEATFQPKIILFFAVAGFLSGFFFDLKRVFLFFLPKKQVFNHIFSFLAWVFTLLTFYFSNLNTNFGSFRLYGVAIFALFATLECFLSQKVFAKQLTKWYNNFRFKANERKSERKEKI